MPRAFPKRNDASQHFKIVFGGWMQERDATHARRLLGLRPRYERPRSRCAAEKRDELAPFQLIELHSVPARSALNDIELAGTSQWVG